jgi:hypothetical protein
MPSAVKIAEHELCHSERRECHCKRSFAADFFAVGFNQREKGMLEEILRGFSPV